jgi:hypothetical protein
MKAASSEARNATAAATSSARPCRLSNLNVLVVPLAPCVALQIRATIPQTRTRSTNSAGPGVGSAASVTAKVRSSVANATRTLHTPNAGRPHSRDVASKSMIAVADRSAMVINILSPRAVGWATNAPSTVMSGPWNNPWR